MHIDYLCLYDIIFSITIGEILKTPNTRSTLYGTKIKLAVRDMAEAEPYELLVLDRA